MSSAPTPTPAYYPVNDTARSEAERAYLQKLADRAAEQNLSEDLRKYVRDTSIAFTVFAGVFVGLRFLARHRQAARIGVDDYLMVAALLVLVGNMIMNLQLVDQGLGLHSGMLTLPELQRLDQTIVGAEILYVTGVNLYKLSLLFFYFRVFPVRQVRIGGYICGGISTAWNIACVLAATFQCTPRERLWMPWLEGTCINLFLTQLCISVPSILCDVAILGLPLPHVYRLKTNLLQRVLLMFIFLLGSYVVFTSIYRFRIFLLYTPEDVPYSLADGCAWNVIEISSGIVSACIPTLGPLVRDVWKSAWPSTSGASKGYSQSKASGLITIGGTGRSKTGGGGGGGGGGPGGSAGLTAKGSHWNRLTGSDGPSHSSDDLELVPKHAAGRVEVSVHAGPRRLRGGSGGDGEGRPAGADDDGATTDDEYPLDSIRQRTDVEWTVEERSRRSMHVA